MNSKTTFVTVNHYCAGLKYKEIDSKTTFVTVNLIEILTPTIGLLAGIQKQLLLLLIRFFSVPVSCIYLYSKTTFVTVNPYLYYKFNL